MSAALRELLAKATPGPWELATSCSWRRIVTTHGRAVIVPTIQRSDNHPDLDCGTDYVNAELAVAAVNALPKLLAEVERLRAEIVALRRDRGLQQARRKFNRARAETAEAALLAKSAAYDALVARAYQEGWHECAEWAGRDDLHPDVDSKAYEVARDKRLARLLVSDDRPSHTAGENDA